VDPDGVTQLAHLLQEGPPHTYLAAYLVVQNDQWAPTASYTITLVNQADASKSCSVGKSQGPDPHVRAASQAAHLI
jgi:hypothetical protein